MNHYFIIRNSYSSAIDIEVNRRRLHFTRNVTVPSLAAQTDKDCILAIRAHKNDPLLDERMSAWESTGIPIQTSRSMPGKCVQTRLDDDDAIAFDFVERLHRGLAEHHNAQWLSFPCGVVVNPPHYGFKRFPKNQFITRVSERGIFEIQHTKIPDPQPIDEKMAWMWVRHQDARSPHGFDWSNVGIVDELSEQFPFDMTALK